LQANVWTAPPVRTVLHLAGKTMPYRNNCPTLAQCDAGRQTQTTKPKKTPRMDIPARRKSGSKDVGTGRCANAWQSDP